MAQPEFVPVTADDRVREDLAPGTPDRWAADRPAEVVTAGQPHGSRMGSIGPDQGYALKLAKSFHDRLQLAEGESVEDAVAGCLGVALKRASNYGRAPVVFDLEFAFTLWGYLGGAPEDLVAFRRKLFSSVSHHYWDKRDIVDHIRENVFLMSSADIRAGLHDWTEFIDANLAPRINKRTAAMKALADVSGDEH